MSDEKSERDSGEASTAKCANCGRPARPDHGHCSDRCFKETLGRVTAEAPSAPVCRRCNDTHRVLAPEDSGSDYWMCTSCPTPCQMCRVGGTGAFCAVTPCSCACHACAARLRSDQFTSPAKEKP